MPVPALGGGGARGRHHPVADALGDARDDARAGPERAAVGASSGLESIGWQRLVEAEDRAQLGIDGGLVERADRANPFGRIAWASSRSFAGAAAPSPSQPCARAAFSSRPLSRKRCVLLGRLGRKLRRDAVEERIEPLPGVAELLGQPRAAVDGGLRERRDDLVALVQQQREQVVAKLFLARVLAGALHDGGEEANPRSGRLPRARAAATSRRTPCLPASAWKLRNRSERSDALARTGRPRTRSAHADRHRGEPASYASCQSGSWHSSVPCGDGTAGDPSGHIGSAG